MEEKINELFEDYRLQKRTLSEVKRELIKEAEQSSETGQVDAVVMWRFTKIETPESGECVWVCNARDKNSKLIKWGTGDEAFYSYWIPADIPAPPQAT